MVIMITGKCVKCGKSWIINDGQEYAPAHAYIDIKDDGTHTFTIQCVNSPMCEARQTKI